MKNKIVAVSLCSFFALSGCASTENASQEVSDPYLADFEKECSKTYEENFVNKKGNAVAALRESYQKAYLKAKDPKVAKNERHKNSETAFKLCLLVKRMNNE